MQKFLQCNISNNFKFDSRNCNDRSIFIALETGERSGLEFVASALEKGAIGVISQKNIDGMNNISIEEYDESYKNFNIVVPDSLLFMQALAQEKFRILLLNEVKTIAVTGSVGKTTTKETIANTLNLYGKTHANFGNYNNHIGVPLTILNCPIDAKFLVLEMGMNHSGEIKTLIEIAPCDFRIITNAKENHAGNFASGVDGVLEAKFEIMEGNRKFCLFILHELFERFKNNKILVEKYAQNQMHIMNGEENVEYHDGKTVFSYNEKLFTQNAIYSNAQVQMFCLSIALMESVLECDLDEIIVPQLKGRGSTIMWNGVRIIDESYNASPASMQNAIENFGKIKGSKLCILGDMRELGNDASKMHQSISPFLKGFDCLLVGEHFSGVKVDGAKYFANYDSIKQFLLANEDFPKSYHNILVKASNGTNLWKLFDDVFKDSTQKSDLKSPNSQDS